MNKDDDSGGPRFVAYLPAWEGLTVLPFDVCDVPTGTIWCQLRLRLESASLPITCLGDAFNEERDASNGPLAKLRVMS